MGTVKSCDWKQPFCDRLFTWCDGATVPQLCYLVLTQADSRIGPEITAQIFPAAAAAPQSG